MRIGSLCSGYGGLDMAVEAVTGAGTAWVSDIDKGACKVLAHRFPDVPNIGDMTKVDWADVEPVDVITGGTPCQDLSHAGKRAGMTEGTRSNLWVAMREAIATIRPSLVIWENVDGAASAAADSDLERDARLLAGVRRRDGRPVLRALGRVVGDLSSLGYVGSVGTVRASDVGAPHRRTRRFLAAAPADTERGGCDGWAREAWGATVGRVAPDGHPQATLLPTPRSSDGTKGLRTASGAAAEFARKGRGCDLATVLTLLPTPAVNDMGEGKSIEAWDAWTERMKAEHDNGNGHGKSLAIELLRTPPGWGPYATAVAQWEQVVGRYAPKPSESALVREWMMGLPAGWITDVPSVTRNEALKLCGNGVVPQQAEAAIRFLLGVIARQGAAA